MKTDSDNAKNVICAIVAASGGRIHGKLRLNKAFYYAHLFYWQEHTGTLTTYPMVHMPNGPEIEQADDLLVELKSEGRIDICYESIGPYKENVYQLLHPFQLDPADSRYEAIRRAVEFINGKSAAELSEETRIYSRSWREGSDGDVLDIYIDLLDDEEYASVQRGLRSAEELLNGAFGEYA